MGFNFIYTMNMRVIFLNIILFPFFIIGQEMITYKSITLDSLVWLRINQRLIDMNKSPIVEFENGSMKAFADRVCLRLIPKDVKFDHSDNDSISYYSGGECIYGHIVNSTSESDVYKELMTNNLNYFAKLIVDGWISSDSHREAISEDWYESSTVSTLRSCL